MSFPLHVSDDAKAIGDMLLRWRLVRELPAAIVAERAGISLTTLRPLEGGEGETVRLGAFLSVARTLGATAPLIASLEPLNTEIGRLRADRMNRRRAPR